MMIIDSIQNLCTLAATIACVLMMWQSIIACTSPWVPGEALSCLENMWYIWRGKTLDSPLTGIYSEMRGQENGNDPNRRLLIFLYCCPTADLHYCTTSL